MVEACAAAMATGSAQSMADLRWLVLRSLLPSIRVLAAHGVDAGTRTAIRRRAVKVVQVTSNALALVNATTGVLPFLPLAYNRGKAWSLLPSSCLMKCMVCNRYAVNGLSSFWYIKSQKFRLKTMCTK